MALPQAMLVVSLLPACFTTSETHRTYISSTQQDYGRTAVPAEKLSEKVSIDVNLTDVLATTDPQFLSVTLLVYLAKSDWAEVNVTAPRVLNMARALAPCMLRVGGTANVSNFSMTAAQWDTLNQFTQHVGWELTFGLNSLLRNPYPVGVWDPKNAEELMKYSNSRGYTINWELGNEPDLWGHHGYNITATEHAKDFFVLKQLVETERPLGTKIFGPDVTKNAASYLTIFLRTVGNGILDAITWHHYYSTSGKAVLADYYSVPVLDSFLRDAVQFSSIARQEMAGADLWLGETGTMYSSDQPHFADSYVNGFMWLDKLGVAAITGHKRVCREDFVAGYYGLLDSQQNPRPDYWLSLLHKKLVGTRVLYVLGSLEMGRKLRVYAHCAKPPYLAGSVVLLLINTQSTNVTADLLNEELVSSERDVFWLSPPAGELTSDIVLLNGALLELVGDRDLPQLMPQTLPASPTISLPPLSFGFIVFKDTKAHACL